MRNDPKFIFSCAENYFYSAMYLQDLADREDGVFETVLFPVLTFHAFSLELYFKSLIVNYTGRTPRDHDLWNLFRKIEPRMQSLIKAAHLAYIQPKLAFDKKFHEIIGKPDPTDFDGVLKASRNSFEGLRYVYEIDKKATFIAGTILKSTRATITEQHPDWVNAGMRVTRRWNPLDK